jgi:hypothetical protein
MCRQWELEFAIARDRDDPQVRARSLTDDDADFRASGQRFGAGIDAWFSGASDIECPSAVLNYKPYSGLPSHTGNLKSRFIETYIAERATNTRNNGKTIGLG